MLLKPQKHKTSISTFYFRWILLLALCVEGKSMTSDLITYHFTAGLAFKLECNREPEMQNLSVSWSLGTGRSLENVTGIKIKPNALWFLPAESFHSGEYSCFSRKGNETWETIFNVSVENGTCPRWDRESITKSTKELRCSLNHIFDLDPQYQITWFKNCSPFNVTTSRILQINRSSEMDGLYTCFVTFTFDGQKYSTAQTTQIKSHSLDDGVTPPTIILPKNDTRTVTLGESLDLTCKAFIGKNNTEEILMYWLSDSLSEHLDLNFNYITVVENNRMYMLCTLHIPEVTAEYLHHNLYCVIQHPAGGSYGIMRLIPANQSERHCWLVLGLVTVLLLLGAVLFHLFKVDLVLTYRDLCMPVSVQSDGKSYDAYVSYLHGDQLSLSSSMTFALHYLPAVLEDLYGYKLFISGRDELPGAAVQDIIADRMNRCRRLIIVLTSQSFANSQTDDKRSLLSDCELAQTNPSAVQIWGSYEQRVGLYDALVKEGLKVILVQMDDGMEESLLPESLRYISRTKGILKWRLNSSTSANRKFWKHLRYHMPPARQQKSKQVMTL
ncbi:interleukin-1 receptor type 1-like [Xyrauchen texanus]|uniref:interleukin-1 receptor type 1-like n=1 Tax=Xyrauchen texanus TaxID=154827 RepID=UPI0022424414|nr:interleukin-1 receptor type 1-like [Xyrauchen texanus]